MADINVVPYIDVMLVLLVIFMVTAPLTIKGLHVELPESKVSNLQIDHSQFLVITVNKEGNYSSIYNKITQSELELDKLLEQAKQYKAANPDMDVLIRGDKNALYGYIINLISALNAAGITNVGFVTKAH